MFSCPSDICSYLHGLSKCCASTFILSDMDLCYIGPPGRPPRSASELVEVLGKAIELEAPQFTVKMLPRARIPIIKLNMPPTQANPYGISCDIGFENRLALENTRLLLTYAMVDPRLRTIVLFRKLLCSLMR